MRRLAQVLMVIGCAAAPSMMPAGTFVLPSFFGAIEYDAQANLVMVHDFSQPESRCDATSQRVSFWRFLMAPSQGRISSATLWINETRDAEAEERPPVVHEVWWYKGGMNTSSADYEDGTFIGTFETDLNDPPGSFTFDVTEIIRANKGRSLGFRVWTREPYCEDGNGTRFGEQLTGAWLDIRP